MITNRNKQSKEAVISRETLMCHARALLSKDVFSKEDSARVEGLTQMAALLPPESRLGTRDRRSEFRALDWHVRGGRLQQRTLGDGTQTQTVATPALVHQQFLDKLMPVMAAFDDLFSPDAVMLVRTATGAPIILPSMDDTANAATEVAEGEQDTEGDPTLLAPVALASAPTFRSGIVKCDRELVQDSAFSIVDLLTAAFAIRLSRGAGRSLVSTLVGDAKLGRTATGSSDVTGGAETGSDTVGWTDLCQLRKSVNAAYRRSPKCCWGMNDDTMTALDSLLDKNGHPIMPQDYDENGNRVLMGYPVRIFPSLDDLGASKKPILFGDLGYFAVRIVEEGSEISVLNERFADFDQLGFRSDLRANGGLLGVTATDSPVKYLANAA
jgi:HK97 family phage major capsid protein